MFSTPFILKLRPDLKQSKKMNALTSCPLLHLPLHCVTHKMIERASLAGKGRKQKGSTVLLKYLSFIIRLKTKWCTQECLINKVNWAGNIYYSNVLFTYTFFFLIHVQYTNCSLGMHLDTKSLLWLGHVRKEREIKVHSHLFTPGRIFEY